MARYSAGVADSGMVEGTAGSAVGGAKYTTLLEGLGLTMYYELKGRLIEIASQNHAEYKAWHRNVMDRLQDLDPNIRSYYLNSSVMFGGSVGGVIIDQDPDEKRWKKTKQDRFYSPRYSTKAGKIAGRVIEELPREPDVVKALLKEIGFKDRYFMLSGKISAPGYTYLPRLQRAFLEWDEAYPTASDVPDMVEVLTSAYHLACEENNKLAKAVV